MAKIKVVRETNTEIIATLHGDAFRAEMYMSPEENICNSEMLLEVWDQVTDRCVLSRYVAIRHDGQKGRDEAKKVFSKAIAALGEPVLEKPKAARFVMSNKVLKGTDGFYNAN